MVWALLVASLLARAHGTQASPASRAELRSHYEQAAAAHRAGDYERFLAESRIVQELAPRSLRAAYNVACGHALLGREKEALAILDRLARMGVAFDLAKEDDFAAIKASSGFQGVVRRMAALRAPLGTSSVAFTIGEKDLLPEGVAHDAKTGAFFVSSVHKRKIVRVADGRASDFVPEGQDGLLSTLAMAVDPARRALWVSTDGLAQTRGLRKEDEGRSTVVEFDLDSGRRRRAIGPPASFPGARFADLTVGPGGELWVADPWSGRLYVLRSGEGSFRVFLEPGTLDSPQGLAFSPDGTWLFAADYTQGVVRIDPRTATASLLDVPADAAVTGIDGLVWAGGGLVGIQNGVLPHRVTRFRLDAGLEHITEVAVLERGNPHFNEPTLGVVVGDDLYYVANSQYAAFGENGQARSELLKDPVILRLRVKP
jgi:sugar lactone lactonase YvrE